MTTPGLTFLLLALLGQAAPARRPVVLTTDLGCEVDDQWALTHLALSPALDLRGIVTTHAPSLAAPAAETSARQARAWLDRLPLAAKPPVIAGSSLPLADRTHPRANAGVAFLIEQAKGYTGSDRLVVLVIGAATDVASALLLDPTCADRVTIVAMGFNAWPVGGDVWNVKNDVAAWQVLLASRAPIVVGDSAVTRRHLVMTPARSRALLGKRGEPAPALVAELEEWVTRHPKLAHEESGQAGAWPIWDEVTVASLLGMTRAETHPRPRLRDDMTFDHADPRGTITWITAIDEARLWRDLVESLDRALNARSR